MADHASLQQAILAVALAGGRFEPGAHAALLTAQAQQAADLGSFRNSATSEESWALTQTLASPLAAQAQAVEQRATAAGDVALALGPDASQQWGTGMSFTVGWMRHAQQQVATWITGYAQASQRSAMRTAMITAGAALAVLVLVLLVTLMVARSMVRPLRRLEAAALDVAGARLPEEVRALGAVGDPGPPSPVMPVDVRSTDEIGQVARAFDRVHREALRLAGEEARRRRSVSAVSAGFFRRSHSLLERLLRLIDSLERSEDDPGRLASLFQIDHLVTRMRRNSDSALVLAGHERSGDWTDTVTLVDVLRAAVSEIEQYNRVVLDIQHGDWVSGGAVADTVHLLAELLENATAYSPKTTQVIVSGQAMRDGGVLITVTDAGPGMPEEFLAQINWQLANPPTADLVLTRHMGLFAVAHLAARHGIEVALETPPDGGTTAEVYLPATLVSPDAQEPQSAPRPQISVPMPQPEGRQPEGAQPGGALPVFDSVESDYPRAVSGLPQRIPQARPASGASADQAAPPAAATEPAEVTRGQVASFQRGSRRARDVVSTDRTRQPERDR
jgi:signal transduction histidine kinase